MLNDDIYSEEITMEQYMKQYLEKLVKLKILTHHPTILGEYCLIFPE